MAAEERASRPRSSDLSQARVLMCAHSCEQNTATYIYIGSLLCSCFKFAVNVNIISCM